MQDNLSVTHLDCIPASVKRTWALLGLGELEGGCLVAETDGQTPTRIAGYFDAQTGCVFACSSLQEAEQLASAATKPAADLLVVGQPHEDTGQLKALQSKGNYLRICRWDRMEQGTSIQPNAAFRTLPQCGCGGHLGMPKMFDSFVEMAAYHFCLFCD